jgi:hypothetical protein
MRLWREYGCELHFGELEATDLARLQVHAIAYTDQRTTMSRNDLYSAVSRADKRIQQVIGKPHVAIDDRKDQGLSAYVKRWGLL